MVFFLFFQGRNEPFQKNGPFPRRCFQGTLPQDGSKSTSFRGSGEISCGCQRMEEVQQPGDKGGKVMGKVGAYEVATPFSNDSGGLAKTLWCRPGFRPSTCPLPNPADPSARRPMPLATTTCCWRGAQRNSTIRRRSLGSNPMRSSTMPSSLGRGFSEEEDGIPMW